MYQVDATAENADELDSKIEEIWAGQPSLEAHPRETFEKSKEAVADLIAVGGLRFPLNVSVSFQERTDHPDNGWGPSTTPGSVQVVVREVG